MKTSTDYARERGIANALAHLILDLPSLPPELLPLVEAVQSGDWQGIANAALYHSKPAAVLLDDSFALLRLRWIADRPEAFGLTEMTKADALFILQDIMGEQRPANLKETWKRAGLDHLPQAHGNGQASPTKMRSTFAAWKQEQRRQAEEIRRGKPKR